MTSAASSAAIVIRSIALDPASGQLMVKLALPAGSDYEFIWRDASGIRWDSAERALVADVQRLNGGVASMIGDSVVGGNA